MTRVLGVDARSRDLTTADHLVKDWVARLALPEGLLACTHFVQAPRPHVAVSVRAALPDGLWERAAALAEEQGTGVALGPRRAGPAELAETAAEAAGRADGRAVLFPGVERLTGDVPMDTVLGASGIDRLTVLGGQAEPTNDDVLRTRDHVRPEWRNDVLSLAISPAGAGRYVPFEVPNPTPCCADH